MTADAILEAYRSAVATETADACADIARLEDEVRAANGALYAAQNRLAAIVTRHNADLYRDLHVKVDPVTGDAVARQGKPTKAAQAARSVSAPVERDEAMPAPTSATGDPAADVALATAADAFMAAISDDRTPEQARIVLADIDWAVDEMDQYSDTALVYAAKHGLGPSQVTRTDDGGMQVDATGEVIP